MPCWKSVQCAPRPAGSTASMVSWDLQGRQVRRRQQLRPAFWEEAPLLAKRLRDNIFTHCNLRCEFCQNCEISQESKGDEISPGELAGLMLHLQRMGCHNINLVSPSHFVPQFLEALAPAAARV